MSKQGIAPWHMWGKSERIGPIVSGVTGNAFQTTQIARVSYGRPDTWRFLWEVTMLDAHITSPTADLVLALRVTTGVGRSMITMNLSRFHFAFIAPGDYVGPLQKFTNNGNGPAHDDANPTAQNVIDSFVGQDIQVEVLSQLLAVNAGDFANVETTALFAPNAHIRPEWTRGEYPGDENHGR